MSVGGRYSVVAALTVLLLRVHWVSGSSCEGRPGGYYADTASSCTRYLLCTSPNSRGRLFSCPPGTRFQQSSLVCDHAANVLCVPAPASSHPTVADNRKRTVEGEKRTDNSLKSREKNREPTTFPNTREQKEIRWTELPHSQKQNLGPVVSLSTTRVKRVLDFKSSKNHKSQLRPQTHDRGIISKVAKEKHFYSENLIQPLGHWNYPQHLTQAHKVPVLQKLQLPDHTLGPPNETSKIVFFPQMEDKTENIKHKSFDLLGKNIGYRTEPHGVIFGLKGSNKQRKGFVSNKSIFPSVEKEGERTESSVGKEVQRTESSKDKDGHRTVSSEKREGHRTAPSEEIEGERTESTEGKEGQWGDPGVVRKRKTMKANNVIGRQMPQVGAVVKAHLTESGVVREGHIPQSGVGKSEYWTKSSVVKETTKTESSVVRGGQRTDSGVVKGSQSTESGVVRGGQRTESYVVRGGQRTESGVVRGGQRGESYVVRGGQRTESGFVRGGQRTESGVVRGGQRTESGFVRGGQNTKADLVKKGQMTKPGVLNLGREVNSLISQSGRELGEKMREEQSQYSRHTLPTSSPPFSIRSLRTGDFLGRTVDLQSIPFSRVIAVQSRRGNNTFSRLMTLQELLELLTRRKKAVRMIPIPVTQREARFIKGALKSSYSEKEKLENLHKSLEEDQREGPEEWKTPPRIPRLVPRLLATNVTTARSPDIRLKKEGSSIAASNSLQNGQTTIKEKRKPELQGSHGSQYQLVYQDGSQNETGSVSSGVVVKPRGHKTVLDNLKIQKFKDLAQQANKLDQTPPLQFGFKPILAHAQKDPVSLPQLSLHLPSPQGFYPPELDSLRSPHPHLRSRSAGSPRSSRGSRRLQNKSRKSNLDFLGIFDTRKYFYIPAKRRQDHLREPTLVSSMVSFLTGV